MRRRGIALTVLCLLGGAGSYGWAADMPTGKEYTNSIGMKLVRIEPGEYLMGQLRVEPAVAQVINQGQCFCPLFLHSILQIEINTARPLNCSLTVKCIPEKVYFVEEIKLFEH